MPNAFHQVAYCIREIVVVYRIIEKSIEINRKAN